MIDGLLNRLASFISWWWALSTTFFSPLLKSKQTSSDWIAPARKRTYTPFSCARTLFFPFSLWSTQACFSALFLSASFTLLFLFAQLFFFFYTTVASSAFLWYCSFFFFSLLTLLFFFFSLVTTVFYFSPFSLSLTVFFFRASNLKKKVVSTKGRSAWRRETASYFAVLGARQLILT